VRTQNWHTRARMGQRRHSNTKSGCARGCPCASKDRTYGPEKTNDPHTGLSDQFSCCPNLLCFSHLPPSARAYRRWQGSAPPAKGGLAHPSPHASRFRCMPGTPAWKADPHHAKAAEIAVWLEGQHEALRLMGSWRPRGRARRRRRLARAGTGYTAGFWFIGSRCSDVSLPVLRPTRRRSSLSLIQPVETSSSPGAPHRSSCRCWFGSPAERTAGACPPSIAPEPTPCRRGAADASRRRITPGVAAPQREAEGRAASRRVSRLGAGRRTGPRALNPASASSRVRRATRTVDSEPRKDAGGPMLGKRKSRHERRRCWTASAARQRNKQANHSPCQRHTVRAQKIQAAWWCPQQQQRVQGRKSSPAAERLRGSSTPRRWTTRFSRP
jgi:hypothetical protein